MKCPRCETEADLMTEDDQGRIIGRCDHAKCDVLFFAPDGQVVATRRQKEQEEARWRRTLMAK